MAVRREGGGVTKKRKPKKAGPRLQSMVQKQAIKPKKPPAAPRLIPFKMQGTVGKPKRNAPGPVDIKTWKPKYRHTYIERESRLPIRIEREGTSKQRARILAKKIKTDKGPIYYKNAKILPGRSDVRSKNIQLELHDGTKLPAIGRTTFGKLDPKTKVKLVTGKTKPLPTLNYDDISFPGEAVRAGRKIAPKVLNAILPGTGKAAEDPGKVIRGVRDINEFLKRGEPKYGLPRAQVTKELFKSIGNLELGTSTQGGSVKAGGPNIKLKDVVKPLREGVKVGGEKAFEGLLAPQKGVMKALGVKDGAELAGKIGLEKQFGLGIDLATDPLMYIGAVIAPATGGASLAALTARVAATGEKGQALLRSAAVTNAARKTALTKDADELRQAIQRGLDADPELAAAVKKVTRKQARDAQAALQGEGTKKIIESIRKGAAAAPEIPRRAGIVEGLKRGAVKGKGRSKVFVASDAGTDAVLEAARSVQRTGLKGTGVRLQLMTPLGGTMRKGKQLPGVNIPLPEFLKVPAGRRMKAAQFNMEKSRAVGQVAAKYDPALKALDEQILEARRMPNVPREDVNKLVKNIKQEKGRIGKMMQSEIHSITRELNKRGPLKWIDLKTRTELNNFHRIARTVNPAADEFGRMVSNRYMRLVHDAVSILPKKLELKQRSLERVDLLMRAMHETAGGEAALAKAGFKFTEQERQVANSLRLIYDDYLRHGQELGVFGNGLQGGDYVPRVWMDTDRKHVMKAEDVVNRITENLTGGVGSHSSFLHQRVHPEVFTLHGKESLKETIKRLSDQTDLSDEAVEETANLLHDRGKMKLAGNLLIRGLQRGQEFRLGEDPIVDAAFGYLQRIAPKRGEAPRPIVTEEDGIIRFADTNIEQGYGFRPDLFDTEAGRRLTPEQQQAIKFQLASEDLEDIRRVLDDAESVGLDPQYHAFLEDMNERLADEALAASGKLEWKVRPGIDINQPTLAGLTRDQLREVYDAIESIDPAFRTAPVTVVSKEYAERQGMAHAMGWADQTQNRIFIVYHTDEEWLEEFTRLARQQREDDFWEAEYRRQGGSPDDGPSDIEPPPTSGATGVDEVSEIHTLDDATTHWGALTSIEATGPSSIAALARRLFDDEPVSALDLQHLRIWMEPQMTDEADQAFQNLFVSVSRKLDEIYGYGGNDIEMMVDAMRLFHGTKPQNVESIVKNGFNTDRVYLVSDPNYAQRYVFVEGDGVIQVDHVFKNPTEHRGQMDWSVIQEAKAAGHDAIIHQTPEGRELAVIALKPKELKNRKLYERPDAMIDMGKIGSAGKQAVPDFWADTMQGILAQKRLEKLGYGKGKLSAKAARENINPVTGKPFKEPPVWGRSNAEYQAAKKKTNFKEKASGEITYKGMSFFEWKDTWNYRQTLLHEYAHPRTLYAENAPFKEAAAASANYISRQVIDLTPPSEWMMDPIMMFPRLDDKKLQAAARRAWTRHLPGGVEVNDALVDSVKKVAKYNGDDPTIKGLARSITNLFAANDKVPSSYRILMNERGVHAEAMIEIAPRFAQMLGHNEAEFIKLVGDKNAKMIKEHILMLETGVSLERRTPDIQLNEDGIAWILDPRGTPPPGRPPHWYGADAFDDPFDYSQFLPDFRDESMEIILDPRRTNYYRTRSEGVISATVARIRTIDLETGRSIDEARGMVKLPNGSDVPVTQLRLAGTSEDGTRWYEDIGGGGTFHESELLFAERTLIPNGDESIFYDPHTHMEYIRPNAPSVSGQSGRVMSVGDDRVWPTEVYHAFIQELGQAGRYDRLFYTGMDSLGGHVMAHIRYGVTTPFPAYHVRNMVSDIIKSLQADSGVLFHPIANAKLAAAAFGKRSGQINVPGYGKLPLEDFLFLADTYGLNSGHHVAEIYRLMEMGQWNETTAKRVMQEVYAVGPNSRLGQAAIRFGNNRENVMRFITFMQRMRRNGGDAADAAQYMIRHHFNFSDLTMAERKYMRNVFLFYTWYRKNIPLQLMEIMRRPGFFAGIAHGFEDFAQGETPLNLDYSKIAPWLPDLSGELPRQNLIPEHYLNQLGALTGSWNGHSFAVGFGAPWADLATIRLNQEGVRHVLSMTNPAFTTGYQIWAKEDLLTGRDLMENERSGAANLIAQINRMLGGKGLPKDKDGEYVLPYWVDRLLRTVPIAGRATGTIGAPGDPKRDPGRAQKWGSSLAPIAGLNVWIGPGGGKRTRLQREKAAAGYAAQLNDYKLRIRNLPARERKRLANERRKELERKWKAQGLPIETLWNAHGWPKPKSAHKKRGKKKLPGTWTPSSRSGPAFPGSGTPSSGTLPGSGGF